MGGFCTDDLVIELSRSRCRDHLCHLSANSSRGLTDVALGALTGSLRLVETGQFVPGCKRLRRLELLGCPLLSTSKLVSVLLMLPRMTFLSNEKMPHVFESSALFESGLTFSLTNFEHAVTHLERAREKINYHLRSEDQFLLKVNEIFPGLNGVKLTLSHVSDDTSTLRQLAQFRSITSLVLEQPVGKLDQNFRQFLLEKGPRLLRLSLRVHSASLADLVTIFTLCPNLRSFHFYSMVLESGFEQPETEDEDEVMTAENEDIESQLVLENTFFGVNPKSNEEDNFMELINDQRELVQCYRNSASEQNALRHSRHELQKFLLLQIDGKILPDLAELCLGSSGRIAAETDEVNQSLGHEFIRSLLLLRASENRSNNNSNSYLRTLVLSGICSSWIDDSLLREVVSLGALRFLRKLNITGKSPLTRMSGKMLLRHCRHLQQLSVCGWNIGRN